MFDERKGRGNMNVTTELLIGGIFLVLLMVSAVWAVAAKHRRRSSDAFEDMEGHEFEYFCAELLKSHGFCEVEVTKGSGDYPRGKGWSDLCDSV